MAYSSQGRAKAQRHPHYSQWKRYVLSVLATLFACSALVFHNAAKASPVGDLNKQGEGEMTYLFWTLYNAELYTTPTRTEQALKIEYYRDIESKDLVDATQDQWEKLGYSDSKIKSWIAPLYDMWPNVKQGSTLTIRVSENQQSQFYFDEQPIGTITDTQFGPAFLSIWLSENTSEPELRQQLLGLNK
ncbi:chalcone isomerase family protein [Vibrio fortis]|uniref:chalcone isomerase family protein n=1 Tax=Vibrio fortis TaxID=212667 RepID=UPI0021C3344F|nr:chalcone isomerase family protein [Vibrio fortis]